MNKAILTLCLIIMLTPQVVLAADLDTARRNFFINLFGKKEKKITKITIVQATPIPEPTSVPAVPQKPGTDVNALTMDDQKKAARIDELMKYNNSPMEGMGRFMVEMQNKYRVKAEVVQAIMYADSSLATNLTTKYNPGNVGNTDSCPNCQLFNSWEQGVEHIYIALTNNMLGTLPALNCLSGGGRNKAGFDNCPVHYFYASSLHNWHNNTTNFLAKFYEHPSPADFNRFSIRL